MHCTYTQACSELALHAFARRRRTGQGSESVTLLARAGPRLAAGRSPPLCARSEARAAAAAVGGMRSTVPALRAAAASMAW